MLNTILILVAIVMFTAQTISFKDFNKNLMKNLDSYYLFNFFYFTLSVLVFVVFNRAWEPVSPLTLLLSAGFGFLFLATILLYMKAMETGPLAFSTLLFSMALLVPILFGALFLDEPVNLLQAGGLLLLILTFTLARQTTSLDEKKPNLRWLFFVVAACLGNGCLMTLTKVHQAKYPGLEVEEFLIIAFATAAVVSLILFFLRRNKAGNTVGAVSHLHSKRFVVLVAIAGLTTGLGNLVGLILAGRIPAIIQFPMTNGGLVILATILSSLLYRERITRRTVAGLVIGLLALVLLSRQG